MNMRWKIIIAVLLAFFASYLWGAPKRENLKKYYDGYNEEYFDDRLPKDVIVKWADLSKKGSDGGDLLGLTQEFNDGRIEISIDKGLNPNLRQAEMSLIHEMCHVKVGVGLHDGPPDDRGHGPAHESCMLSIAERGGMQGLW